MKLELICTDPYFKRFNDKWLGSQSLQWKLNTF